MGCLEGVWEVWRVCEGGMEGMWMVWRVCGWYVNFKCTIINRVLSRYLLKVVMLFVYYIWYVF